MICLKMQALALIIFAESTPGTTPEMPPHYSL